MSDAPVIVEVVECAGRKLGHLTLNVPKTLNSLTLPMVDTLQEQLDAWRDDPEIGAIFIDGSGEKAFCAGGDVQALHRSATATPGGPCEEAEAFFAREYRMNYTLHPYPKPIICWGHGIVMGGGLGVMAGCSHRVVTEATRIAMPEVTIALFPDVGGSWFLNHMPGKSGQFLALTGASINAADAVFTGLADRFIASEHKGAVLEQLRRSNWADDGLAHGSPLAALWISRQLQETRHSSLREVFQAELQLATNVVRYPEFAEGVRALLLDKDRNPAWAFKSTREVPQALIDGFFTAPWANNPLADL
mgnify:CR=1 FL=1